LEDDSLALRGDGVVDTGRVAVNAHLGDECPPVDTLELETSLLIRLIGVRPRKSAQLHQKGRRHADGDGGTAAETGTDGDGGAKGVEASGERLVGQAQEEVEECRSRVLVDLAQLLGVVGRDAHDVRLDGGDQVRVELGDHGVVTLLLERVLERLPGKVVDVPCVYEVDVGESEGDGAAEFGEGSDVKVRAEGDGGSDSGLETC
jgi:hypothetical protein